MNSHLARVISTMALMAIALLSPLIAQEYGHKFPVATGSTKTVSVPQSYTPYGQRPFTDKVGQDGSSVVRDPSGALIWSTNSNLTNLVPNSTAARALFVSNSELVVYTNYYSNATIETVSTNSEIVIYRRNNGNLVASQTQALIGRILENSFVTAASYGYRLALATVVDNGDDSRLTTFTGTSTSGTPPDVVVDYNGTTTDVDVYDALQIKLVTIAWNTTPLISPFDFSVQVPIGTDPRDINLLASGDDSSLVYSLNTALTFNSNQGFPPVSGIVNVPFETQSSVLWVSWDNNNDRIYLRNGGFNFTFGQAGYTSNSQLLIEQVPVDGTPSTLVDYRSRNGVLTTNKTTTLSLNESLLPISDYSISGEPIFIYTLKDVNKKIIQLYRYGDVLAPLGSAVTLPSPVIVDPIFTRNPQDASILIKTEGSGGLVWVPSDSETNPTKLLTPKSLPLSTLGLPLFVTASEAVAWMNYGTGVDLSQEAGGSIRPADILHFEKSLTPTILAPPIEGRYLALPGSVTPNPTVTGWFLTTFEKKGTFQALFRNYKLFSKNPSDPKTDTDFDGLTDILELTIGTNPFVKDTDGDGVNDYGEFYITKTDPLVNSFSSTGTAAVTPFFGTRVAGVYEGIVFDAAAAQVMKHSIRLTKNGSFTSSLSGFASNSSFKGKFSDGGSFTGVPGSGSGLIAVQMNMVKQPNGAYYIQGTFTNPSGGTFFFQLRPAVGGIAGNVTFEASVTTSATGPSGAAVATGKFRANGQVSLNVYFPDGGTGSYSGPTVDGNLMAFFCKAKSNGRAVLLGSLRIQDIAGQSDFSGSVRNLSFSNQKGSLYPSGYDQNRFLKGSRYYVPRVGFMPLTTMPLGANNVLLEWADGSFAGLQKVATWSNNGKVYVPETQSGTTKVTFTKATGLYVSNSNFTNITAGYVNFKSKAWAVAVQKNNTFNGFYISGFSAGAFSVQPNTSGLNPELTSVSPLKFDAPAAATTYTVSVGTSDPNAWGVSIPIEAFWVTAVQYTAASDGVGNGTVVITLGLNALYERREAVITIAGVQHTIKQEYR